MSRANKDFTSFVGISLSLFLIMLSILIGGSLLSFLDLQSCFIVVGGTLFVTIACFKWEEFRAATKIIVSNTFRSYVSQQDAAYYCIKISERSYKETVLKLSNSENELKKVSLFLWEGIRLASDNATIEFIDHTLTQYLIFMVERHKKTISILKKAGEIAPAMGLIGTLVGLVQMLNNLNDIAKIGPAMAVALLTTFYGAVISYVVTYPLASKLERNTQEELIINKLFFETVISIAKKENPRLLEITLNNILPNDQKIQYFEQR